MSVQVPRYLHEPIRILWFDLEDLGVILLGYFFWLMLESWLVIPIAVLVPAWFIRLKRSKPRGYLGHLLYYYGFSNLKGYPPPTTREFHE